MSPTNRISDALLKGSRLIGQRSLDIWSGIAIERRFVEAIEREEEQLDVHYAILWGDRPTIAEREYRVGRFQRVVKPAHTLSLGCAGRLPAVRALTSYEVTACVINTHAAQTIVDEMEWKGSFSLHEHLGVSDLPLSHLITLVSLEAENCGASGKLYCDSLEQALINRFLVVSRIEGKAQPTVSGLPRPQLKRVLDKLANEYDRDLSLSDLAQESGYSRSHFLKMFDVATGKTPFEYLRDVRLEAARTALIDTKDSIVSIAIRTGFCSHSHLTRQFVKRYGLSPSAYRRQLAKL
ncbi:AraC family transcriptional regulator [Rhizobiaceae bacterium n13]|uniref:AraC family transcriptional regulator n=1 Tax=Ferirhizobium litorale TaxID=2927786 RepID=A0AAE3QAJ7_9HYPH|nr:AraC family transcriptional regulator [Fererhizobium litorale]MDI7864711.1 AraC family transcriptional regulator [Fererhizobium litorale]MDI7922202.1 AraC family transcriptional regulator [Fererhizobium litorale]